MKDYMSPEIDIQKFEIEDIIAVSGGGKDDDSLTDDEF